MKMNHHIIMIMTNISHNSSDHILNKIIALFSYVNSYKSFQIRNYNLK